MACAFPTPAAIPDRARRLLHRPGSSRPLRGTAQPTEVVVAHADGSRAIVAQPKARKSIDGVPRIWGATV
jgi:hypothetical protein